MHNVNSRNAEVTVPSLDDWELPGTETAEDEGWKSFLWKHNALRHPFISYRVAQTQGVARVALEEGNSPQMIFQH